MGLSELIKAGFTRREANVIYASSTPDDDSALVTKAIATAKGDLFAATAAGVIARLGAGTDGQVLTADAASAVGLKYVTVAGPAFRGAWSGMQAVVTDTFTTGVPAGFTMLKAPVYAATSGVGAPPGNSITWPGAQNTQLMSAIAPAGVSAVRFYAAQPAWEGGGNPHQSFIVAGVTMWNGPTGSWGWTQIGPYPCAPGDLLQWSAPDPMWQCTPSDAYVEFLRAISYAVGDAVTYNGSLYVCASANTIATPGVDANWTKLLIGTAP